MSGYRDDDRLSGLENQTFGWRTSHYGFGALAISLALLFTGESLAVSIAFGVMGAALVLYGWRNPD